MQISLQLVSLGTVPPATGHNLKPRILKPWVAVVNGSALYCLLKEYAMTFRGNSMTFLIGKSLL